MLTVEHPAALKADQERTALSMFETFNVPAYLSYSAAGLVAMHERVTTATIVSIGHDTTNIVPVYQGNFSPFMVFCYV